MRCAVSISPASDSSISQAHRSSTRAPPRSAALRCRSARRYRLWCSRYVGSTWNSNRSITRRRRSAPSVINRCESGVTETMGRNAASSDAALTSTPPRRIRNRSVPCSMPVVSAIPSDPIVDPTMRRAGFPSVTTSRRRCARKERPVPRICTASRRLDFPLPFGPTTRLMRGENSRSTSSIILRCLISIEVTRMTDRSYRRPIPGPLPALRVPSGARR